MLRFAINANKVQHESEMEAMSRIALFAQATHGAAI